MTRTSFMIFAVPPCWLLSKLLAPTLSSCLQEGLLLLPRKSPSVASFLFRILDHSGSTRCRRWKIWDLRFSAWIKSAPHNKLIAGFSANLLEGIRSLPFPRTQPPSCRQLPSVIRRSIRLGGSLSRCVRVRHGKKHRSIWLKQTLLCYFA